MRTLLLLLLLFPFVAHADGAPATGCPTGAPDTQGYPRNLPCCTHPNYNPATDGTSCLAPVSSFNLVMKEFGFLRNDGVKFYFGSEQSFDLASVNAGAEFGQFVAGANMPAGTYVGIIPVVKSNVTATVDVTIPGGRRCTLDSTFPIFDESEPPPACTADMPNLETLECTDGEYGRFIDDHLFNIDYDPARGMTAEFGFYLDNGAICDFSGSGDVTATYFDMPVVIRVRAN